MRSSTLRIGMTLGDPAGVGPDLVVRTLATDGGGDVVVYGDRTILDAAARRAGLPAPSRVIEVSALGDLPPGRPQPADEARVGAAQVAYLEAAVAGVRAGEIDALVTAPINKALCRAAGFVFPGHTEFLAERLGAPRVAMMLAGPHLRVVPATIHVALSSVPSLLADALPDTILLTARALRDEFALPHPRIAVAALNPHAGEGGHFGDEEARLIVPAIERARVMLQNAAIAATVDGPAVPDAVYRAAAAPPFGDGRYDAVVGMYHDQALIPVKLVDFDEAVNVTLGLSVVRTSPDHGVAYDVAGTDRVRSVSFLTALSLARRLANGRQHQTENKKK